MSVANTGREPASATIRRKSSRPGTPADLGLRRWTDAPAEGLAPNRAASGRSRTRARPRRTAAAPRRNCAAARGPSRRRLRVQRRSRSVWASQVRATAIGNLVEQRVPAAPVGQRANRRAGPGAARCGRVPGRDRRAPWRSRRPPDRGSAFIGQLRPDAAKVNGQVERAREPAAGVVRSVAQIAAIEVRVGLHRGDAGIGEQAAQAREARSVVRRAAVPAHRDRRADRAASGSSAGPRAAAATRGARAAARERPSR